MLTEPNATDISVGENPRYSDVVVSLYRELRDARSQARDDERRAEVSEGSMTTLSEAWTPVQTTALEILKNHAQDIEIGAWLIEAATRLHGFEGLKVSFETVTGMIRRHGTALHPQPEEEDEPHFLALAGLNGIGREGALVQPLRLLPLVPGYPFGQMTLWDATGGGRADDVQRAMDAVSSEQMTAQFESIVAARIAIEDCDAAATECLGADAPPFATLIETLSEIERTVRGMGSLDSADVAEPEHKEHAPPAAAAAPQSGEIISREQAFEELLKIARYFRKAEPHSPISHSIETLVQRGRMDFLSLLKELIPDQNLRENVMTTAGIREHNPEDGHE